VGKKENLQGVRQGGPWHHSAGSTPNLDTVKLEGQPSSSIASTFLN
jgi:hypothetical protein